MVKPTGAIIMIKYQDLYLMGQETSFLTENEDIMKVYPTLKQDFFSPGSTENKEDLDNAKAKFTELCEQLEKRFPEIPKITFADIRNSRTNPGFIAATPRYVTLERRKSYGFPKGSYEDKDGSLINTIIRECNEETGIILRPESIEDLHVTASTGRKGNYAVYTYNLGKSAYEDFSKILMKKNKSRENEIHELQFIKIPKYDYKNFFTNNVSKEAFLKQIKRGGAKRKTLKSKYKLIL